MELLEKLVVDANKIQKIAFDDYKRRAYVSHDILYAIKGRDYILVSFFEKASIIYMIDVSNFYLSGYMWKNDNSYSCLYSSGGKVIAHSFDIEVRICDITENDLKPCNPKTDPTKTKSIKKTLDKVSFALCESTRFEAISKYLCYKGQEHALAKDLKLLTNNWKIFNCTYNISLKDSLDRIKDGSIKEPNIESNPLYQFMLKAERYLNKQQSKLTPTP